jgi:hypothetical protein
VVVVVVVVVVVIVIGVTHHHHHHHLTPQGKVLDKLVVTQLVKKFSAFHGT